MSLALSTAMLESRRESEEAAETSGMSSKSGWRCSSIRKLLFFLEQAAFKTPVFKVQGELERRTNGFNTNLAVTVSPFPQFSLPVLAVT